MYPTANHKKTDGSECKKVGFFFILFFKGPQFRDKLPLFQPEMSLSPQNSSESVKKMIWRKKNGCHPSFIGHLTPKTLTKQLATTKNTFWGQFPTFSTKMFSSFFRYYDKLIEESSQRKKNGCHPSNYGYLTHKTPSEHGKTQFPSIL